jgi:hypothetical protein
MSKNNEDKLIGFFILLLLIAIAWLISIYVLNHYFPKLDERAIFGDSFGTINSLFSGLALGGIIYTIFQQKKELKLQREEISKTREEFVTQNTTLRLQRFENTFFNLLSLHHQIVNAIDLDFDRVKRNDDIAVRLMRKTEYEIISLKGRDVFKHKFEILVDRLKSSKEDINKTYLNFYSTVQTDFGHYFRNLYRIIKMVDETEFVSLNEISYINFIKVSTKEEEYNKINHSYRYKYTSMLRAQLSDYELLWLFYNCLTDNGIEKFKPLIERYCLLKNMPKDKIYNTILLNEYKDSAYKHN